MRCGHRSGTLQPRINFYDSDATAIHWAYKSRWWAPQYYGNAYWGQRWDYYGHVTYQFWTPEGGLNTFEKVMPPPVPNPVNVWRYTGMANATGQGTNWPGRAYSYDIQDFTDNYYWPYSCNG